MSEYKPVFYDDIDDKQLMYLIVDGSDDDRYVPGSIVAHRLNNWERLAQENASLKDDRKQVELGYDSIYKRLLGAQAENDALVAEVERLKKLLAEKEAEK